MADDGGHHTDQGHAGAPPVFAQKRASLPKVSKAWWSWAFDARASLWYAPFVLSQTYPVWQPQTVSEAVSTYFGFVCATLLYLVIQLFALLNATTGKNITKESAVLGDMAISAIVFVAHLVVALGYAAKNYVPSEIDIHFLFFSLVVGLIDVAGFTFIAYRANRRGTEVSPE